MKDIDELIKLYEKSSKHSNYQLLPERLSNLKEFSNLNIKSRNEKERLTYFKKVVDFNGKSILDVGGNSGYFSIEVIDSGANHVHYYEGNKEHSDFVKKASTVLEIENKLKVTNKYLSFTSELSGEKYDIILLLNVLHHLGDDYGDKSLTLTKAKENILTQLNSMASKTEHMIFQLGFNWQGNTKLGLFEKGTKKELIEFITNGIQDNWEIERIGIAERNIDGFVYKELNEDNIERDDSLGEFLNRPVFLLKAIN